MAAVSSPSKAAAAFCDHACTSATRFTEFVQEGAGNLIGVRRTGWRDGTGKYASKRERGTKKQG
eukprot:257978-Rhodomonas_salina.2